MRRCDFGWLCGLLTACAAVSGCGTPTAPVAAPPKPPEVVVTLPVVRQVTDYEDFTGRTEAKAAVEVRARVTGYLERVLFKEGTEVKQGDPLFEIDPRPYQAELQRAEATLAQSQARLRRCERDLKRANDLLPQNAISQDDFDQISGDRDEAAAAVKLAEASRDLAQLNLSFTRVTAPITGRISRQLIDPGNLVKADETALTTIVSMDPIYAYFDQDERTLLRVRRLVRAGVLKTIQESAVPVLLGLVDEEGFPHEGRIDFADNRVDAMTGTLRLRGVFANPQRMLSPGLFVRIRLPIGAPHAAVLVSDQALGTDQGQSFVYVVNSKNEVVHHTVTVGPLEGGLRVIEQGLAKDERVIVNGLQRVRPGVKVAPRLLEPPEQALGPNPQLTKPDVSSGTGRS
jgi:RND family efflux transporter MFP subunit